MAGEGLFSREVRAVVGSRSGKSQDPAATLVPQGGRPRA